MTVAGTTAVSFGVRGEGPLLAREQDKSRLSFFHSAFPFHLVFYRVVSLCQSQILCSFFPQLSFHIPVLGEALFGFEPGAAALPPLAVPGTA